MSKRHHIITAVVANSAGEIFEIEGFGAVGMSGSQRIPITAGETIPIPHGGELMYLPDRSPVVYDLKAGQFKVLSENPFVPGERIHPVAVFNSPGYVISHTCAYEEDDGAEYLPLFSYGAAGWQGNSFRTAAICVDREKRQDLRYMAPEKVQAGIRRMRKKMPKNRLRTHLERCALTYGCPAGKNFFLGRYEAPLPTSKTCNARCLGCLSLQPDEGIPQSQNRIDFTPDPGDITEVAVAHIQSVRHAVVSFGQGCEGDPLFAAKAIIPAIRSIRATTSKGTINLNTNGSRPDILEALFDAGLDSMRVSMNSARPDRYETYFRPSGYDFSDVMKGIDVGLDRGKFISINYLNCPGITDTPEEEAALMKMVREHTIHMIQWRNLNFDPLRYRNILSDRSSLGKPMGMMALLKRIRKNFPKLKYGYFNPPKEKFNIIDDPWNRKKT